MAEFLGAHAGLEFALVPVAAVNELTVAACATITHVATAPSIMRQALGVL